MKNFLIAIITNKAVKLALKALLVALGTAAAAYFGFDVDFAQFVN